jgi:tetratricopeptide (TPR) repeat protein
MRADGLGNPITTEDDATLGAVDDFVEGFLAYENRATNILGAAERDPASAIANAYAGMIWMLLEAPEAPARAAKYLARAQATQAGATRREQLAVEVLAAWSQDDVPMALALCDQAVAAFPRDLVLVKISQYLNFNLGRFAEMLRVALAVLDANREVAYAHGMAAFAYEQCHLLEEAEAAAREALRLKRKEPWAQHALAHVMITQGRIDEGAHFLEGFQDTWNDLNSFMLSHLWWHLALFYLSQGREARVLHVYDRHVWSVAKDYSQDQIGAVSLLARLELDGIEIGDRWVDVGRFLAVRADDTTQPFLSVQYLYGLARAGRPEANVLMAAIRARAVNAPAFAREAWAQVALPLAEGLLAYAHGDYTAATRKLTPTLPRLMEIGGSHAQRDLFELIRLDALLRSGDLTVAQQQLERRRLDDRDGVPVNRALAKVYAALGLPGEAAKAAARAHRTKAAHSSLLGLHA